MIRRSFVAILICAVLGAASSRVTAQISQNPPDSAQTPSPVLQCSEVSTGTVLACKPQPPTSLVDQGLGITGDSFAPALTVYTANNLATRDSMIKATKGIIPNNPKLAAKVGSTIFDYSRRTGVRAGFGIVVLATGAAAIYEKLFGKKLFGQHDEQTFQLYQVVNKSGIIKTDVSGAPKSLPHLNVGEGR